MFNKASYHDCSCPLNTIDLESSLQGSHEFGPTPYIYTNTYVVADLIFFLQLQIIGIDMA